MLTQTIPVLNLQDFLVGEGNRQQTFVRILGDALRDLGFFALTHHGVDADLIRSAYQVSEELFSLPTDVKAQYDGSHTGGQLGFTSFGKEHAKDHPVPDLKEFWHVGRAGAAASDRTRQNVFPAEVPQFQPMITALYQQLDVCAAVLLEACALYLELPRSQLRDLVQDSDTLLRIIHYPPIPGDAPTASLRAAAHEDINFITLLCEATAPGLELLQRDGTWLPIQALPGQIIVDTGDMLQNLTNGLLKSTTHRVANPGNERDRRFSMPFFVHPRKTVDLTPLPNCVARTGGTPLYTSWTAGEYLTQRLQEIGLG